MSKKYRDDQRNNSLAAETWNGVVNHDTAMIKYAKPPKVGLDLIDYVKKRFGLTDIEFDEVIIGQYAHIVITPTTRGALNAYASYSTG